MYSSDGLSSRIGSRVIMGRDGERDSARHSFELEITTVGASKLGCVRSKSIDPGPPIGRRTLGPTSSTTMFELESVLMLESDPCPRNNGTNPSGRPSVAIAVLVEGRVNGPGCTGGTRIWNGTSCPCGVRCCSRARRRSRKPLWTSRVPGIEDGHVSVGSLASFIIRSNTIANDTGRPWFACVLVCDGLPPFPKVELLAPSGGFDASRNGRLRGAGLGDDLTFSRHTGHVLAVLNHCCTSSIPDLF